MVDYPDFNFVWARSGFGAHGRRTTQELRLYGVLGSGIWGGFTTTRGGSTPILWRLRRCGGPGLSGDWSR